MLRAAPNTSTIKISRPSPPFWPSREESQDPSPAPGAPSSPSADPAARPAGRTAIPFHQSRPGPEDDIMLATGRPRGAPESAMVRERVGAAGVKQERIHQHLLIFNKLQICKINF